MKKPFVIAIPVYDGVDLMDIAAPREVFCWVAHELGPGGLQLYYVADTSPIRTRDGLQIIPDKTFYHPEVQHPDLIWVPGGSPEALADHLKHPDSPFFQYVSRVGAGAAYVTSVCEGAVLLANTGLLDGHQVTTHWAFYPCMAAFPGVELVPPHTKNGQLIYPRYVRDGNRVTGGGISSGMDEALFLVKKIFGKEMAEQVQAITQYFPRPPVQGTLEEATSCPIPDWK